MDKNQWYDKCIALKEEGKLVEAIDQLLFLVAEYPDFALPHLALATLYAKQERFEESVVEAKTATNLAPEEGFYYTALSVLAIKGGKKAEAEEALRKAQETRFAQFQREYKEPQEGENG